MQFTFPKNFLWGTATAAHQVEGGNINSELWPIEHMENTIFVEPSGDAVDHYHRYPEDISLIASLGFNSYRFSVEWARVEVEPGYFSMAALDHYKRMLETCHAHGIKPMMTFHHFTSPRWLIPKGGWLHPDTPARFAAYCQKAMQHFGDLVEAVCTINEVNIPTMARFYWQPKTAEDQQKRAFLTQQMAALFGVTPENFAPFQFAFREESRAIILEAHRGAVSAIKAERASLPVGLTIAMQDMQALEGGEATRDHLRAEIQDVFLEAAQGDDFVGVQTYSRERIGPDGPVGPEEGVEGTQMDYEFWPEALEATIRYANQKAGVPVIVTENGLATDDDTRRAAYYQRALTGVANCLQDGLDVRGFYAWSTFDNFEWMFGYAKTFGLIAVDRSTQKRTAKPSAHWLGRVAQNNQLAIQ